MYVVGRVGSLISQGVYSVATPFHPFGGAVDVIVVKQQDGTFRSTPWYVRFGKFQGVLKGSEKVVRINVNGNEADFHMYLDNSGEAYFVQEVGSAKGRETGGVTRGQSDNVQQLHEDGTIDSIGVPAENIVGIGRLEHSASDSGVAQLRKESDSLAPDRIDRAESDGDRRYYELQDDPSSLEGAVELSEFGSNRYESLDPEQAKDLQGPDSEVILFSVDGHVLTAPVSTSDQNSDTVRLSTPQFHLGPAESTEEFSSGDDVWSMGYVNELNAPASNAEPDNDSSINSEHVFRSKETPNFPASGANHQGQCDSDETNDRIKQENVFKSCLALMELTKQVGEADLEGSRLSKKEDQPTDSPGDSSAKGGYSSMEVQCPEEPCPYSHATADGTEVTGVIESKNDLLTASCGGESADFEGCNELRVEMEAEENNALGVKGLVSGSFSAQSVSVSNDLELKDGEMLASTSTLGLDDNANDQVPEDDCSKSKVLERQRSTSSEHLLTSSNMRFEISLCGKELTIGMGLDAAAEVFEAHRVSVDEFKHRASEITSDGNLILRYEDRYLPWEKASPLVLGLAVFGLDLPVEPKDAIPVDPVETPESREDDVLAAPASASRRWRLWPIPFRRVKTLEHSGSNSSSEELFVDSESGVSGLNIESTSSPRSGCESPQIQFVRTNVPTSEQIASLNLRDGQNMITFSFSTRVLGRQQVEAHIYLWKWNDRIVISDVDGTITKSDVLGQFMPLVGKDWSQSGVAKLFSAIKENGYQLLFLSARAIVQAYLTRNFLFNLKQDGKTLPNGPVVISPDGLFPSLYREVIRRAPHEFKIACLEDIKRLFPPDYNPFYAGFGNRDTDELSYRKIGIPKGKIFIINPKGEVAISHRVDVKSYTSLHTLVDDMFPPTLLVEQEDFNAWNFWKVPLPEIEL